MYENLFVDLGTVSKIIGVLFVENSTKAEPPPSPPLFVEN